jgi:two-component system nitrate/nitrite response regulator NarL
MREGTKPVVGKVSVVVGDDHPLFREGVVRALTGSDRIDVLGEADDGAAALAMIRELRPKVALIDFRMPHLDGTQVAAAVVRDELLPPSIAAGLVGEVRRRSEPSGPTLSAREREVLGLIAQGASIPTIASQLFLAPSTVKTHVQRLYEKLGVNDRGAAVAAAMRQGLLE